MLSDHNNGPHKQTVSKSAMLSRHPLFRDIGPEFHEKLAAYATIRRVKRGARIFSKGDAGSCLFAVCQGVVQIVVPSTQRKDAVFNLIREGELFGEIALLDGNPRSADAVAFSDCELMAIERRDFLPLLHLYPNVAIRLLEVLCARLRQTTEQVEDVMFLDLRSRLAKVLLRLSTLEKPHGTVRLSQSDLSQIVGMSREMINKQLRIWVKDRVIRVERRSITVLQPRALAQIIAEE